MTYTQTKALKISNKMNFSQKYIIYFSNIVLTHYVHVIDNNLYANQHQS